MEITICSETIASPRGDQAWNQTLKKAAASPPASWCKVTTLRFEPKAALLKKHRLDVARPAWVGCQSNGAKLDALEDFEKAGEGFGAGLAMGSNFFWVVRRGRTPVRKIADSKTSELLKGCGTWPVGVTTNGNQLALEFVASTPDPFWEIFRCWNKLLFEWGIKDYQFEVHDSRRAWEQLDVNQAFLHFDSDAIRHIREHGFPGGKKHYPWDSKVCLVRDGILSGCDPGRNGNLLP